MFLDSSAMRADASLACLSLANWSSAAFWPFTEPLDSVSLSGAVVAGLLSSTRVCTEPVAERSADATVVDGALSLTMRFHFDAAGHIVSAWSAARGAVSGRGAKRTTVMTPWEGRWSDYQRRNGLLLPMQGEAAWLPPGGARRPYFEGTVERIAHTFAA